MFAVIRGLTVFLFLWSQNVVLNTNHIKTQNPVKATQLQPLCDVLLVSGHLPVKINDKITQLVQLLHRKSVKYAVSFLRTYFLEQSWFSIVK